MSEINSAVDEMHELPLISVNVINFVQLNGQIMSFVMFHSSDSGKNRHIHDDEPEADVTSASAFVVYPSLHWTCGHQF